MEFDLPMNSTGYTLEATRKKMLTRLIAILLLVMAHGPALLASAWYAAPDAPSGGDGSLQKPWPLQVALTSKTVIKPGDTLYLLGGRYQGPNFVSTISGASNNYVTVRSYPGEWAVVTDGLVGVLQTNLSA